MRFINKQNTPMRRLNPSLLKEDTNSYTSFWQAITINENSSEFSLCNDFFVLLEAIPADSGIKKQFQYKGGRIHIFPDSVEKIFGIACDLPKGIHVILTKDHVNVWTSGEYSIASYDYHKVRARDSYLKKVMRPVSRFSRFQLDIGLVLDVFNKDQSFIVEDVTYFPTSIRVIAKHT